jgi:hypothetical protein
MWMENENISSEIGEPGVPIVILELVSTTESGTELSASKRL